MNTIDIKIQKGVIQICVFLITALVIASIGVAKRRKVRTQYLLVLIPVELSLISEIVFHVLLIIQYKKMEVAPDTAFEAHAHWENIRYSSYLFEHAMLICTIIALYWLAERNRK